MPDLFHSDLERSILMTDFLWWRDGVIYQIYPRSFADSNGDGVGDLAGIIAHLDYLKGSPDALGIDAIWLSPIYPSPMYDFGYDVSDYEDIDAAFGSLADFDRLVAEAHRRGIRVVMDLVMNHTSHLHPWFEESRSNRSNPKRDWYLWKDAIEGEPPNNWQAVFGGRAWEWDPATGQYYFHMFLKEQPDLNWRNPELRARMFQMVRFWAKRGVDGFRLDVVNAYFKDAELRDNPPAVGLRAFDRQKHVFDRDQPEMTGVLRELRSVLDEYPERMAVGEVMGEDPTLAARYCGDGTDQLHLAFNFQFTKQPWKPAKLQGAIFEQEASLPPGAWPCNVLSNHDVDRHASRFGGGEHSDARARVAAALLLTLRGTPFLYYGEELGLLNTPIPRLEIQDPPGKRYWPIYKGRDPARTPMPWDGSSQAGFTSGRPWLRLNRDYQTRNVAAQKEDPGSVFHFYREMLRFRRESVALRRGRWRPVLKRPKSALVYLRESPSQTLLVALNFREKAVEVVIDAPLPAGRWEWRMGAGETPGTLQEGRVSLDPFGVAIFELVG